MCDQDGQANSAQQRELRAADLRALPPQVEGDLTEAKEAIVDGLLGLTVEHCTGTGDSGALLFGAALPLQALP